MTSTGPAPASAATRVKMAFRSSALVRSAAAYSRWQRGVSPASCSCMYEIMSGRSTWYQRKLAGTSSRYARVSRPAAMFKTAVAPSRTARRMNSSMTAVRTIIGHAVALPRGIAATMASPRSPASRRA